MKKHATVTLDDAVRVAHEVAAESPDQVVEVCSYASEGAPSCLVGHVLYRLGWSVNELQELDLGVTHKDAANPSDENSMIHNLARHGYVSLETKAATYLRDAQRYQDAEATWREAVDLADDLAALRNEEEAE